MPKSPTLLRVPAPACGCMPIVSKRELRGENGLFFRGDGTNSPGWTKLGDEEKDRIPRGRNGRTGFFRYLTYSEEDEKWQLVCTDAGHNEVAPRTRYPPNKDGHPHPFKTVAVGRTLTEYQIIYITKGRGVFESNQTTHVVVPGTVMMVSPGDPALLQAVTSTWDGRSTGWGSRAGTRDTLREQGFLSARKPALRSGAAEQPPCHLRQDLRAGPDPAAPLPDQGKLPGPHSHRGGPCPREEDRPALQLRRAGGEGEVLHGGEHLSRGQPQRHRGRCSGSAPPT